MTKLTIASIQYGLVEIHSVEQFWDGLAAKIKEAVAQGVDLLIFPEYVTAHLLSLVPVIGYPEACRYLDSFTSTYRDFFKTSSRETNMVILGGTTIIKEQDGYVNQASLFFPDGHIAVQNKLHLTPEEQLRWNLLEGDELHVFDTRWGKCSILTCYDIEFPELARIAAEKGAELILCPSYTDTAAGYYRVRNCSQARAIENQVFVALSGIVGALKEDRQQIDKGYCQAGIFSPCDTPFPDHGVIQAGEPNEDTMIVATVDFSMLHENRARGVVAPFYNRRPDLYEKEIRTIQAKQSLK
jgi:predicted amidohydrolase